MSFADLAKKRQSDRKYKEQAVEREKLVQCLETARISPSANNSQPWKFVVVDDLEKKEQIAECTIGLGMNKFTHQCPVLVAVVLEKQNFMSTIGSMIKNKDYSLFDIGIAVNQFCLQAADLGLGTCIIGWFDEKKIKKICKGTPYKWAVSSLPSAERTFEFTPKGSNVQKYSKADREEMRRICDEEAVKAGYRLAYVMNQIFSK